MTPNFKNSSTKPIGILGSGYFGTAIANMLAKNTNVLLYVYNPDSLKKIQSTKISAEQNLNEKISATNSIKEIADSCDVIFVIVPSEFFRFYIKKISPFLTKNHTLIHGTKGLEVNWPDSGTISRKNILTMSEIISTETICTKIGCLSGPNLAKELARGEPAGVVLASKNSEVLAMGKKHLENPNFEVFHSNDIIGTELCGVLKNVIAIAVGFVSGMSYGYNTKALMISRGLNEIMTVGIALGAEKESFIGLAGIGDLVATSMSSDSRNHSLGYKLATGHKLKDIINEKAQTIEGINTVKTIHCLAKNYGISTPIVTTLYKLLYEDMEVEKVMINLLNN